MNFANLIAILNANCIVRDIYQTVGIGIEPRQSVIVSADGTTDEVADRISNIIGPCGVVVMIAGEFFNEADGSVEPVQYVGPDGCGDGLHVEFVHLENDPLNFKDTE